MEQLTQLALKLLYKLALATGEDFTKKSKNQKYRSGFRWAFAIIFLPALLFSTYYFYSQNNEIRNEVKLEQNLKVIFQEYWTRVIREKELTTSNNIDKGMRSADLVYNCVKKTIPDDRCEITQNDGSKNLIKYQVKNLSIYENGGNKIFANYMSEASYDDTGMPRTENIYGSVEFEKYDGYLIDKFFQRIPCRLDSDKDILKNTSYQKSIFNCGYKNNNKPYKIDFLN